MTVAAHWGWPRRIDALKGKEFPTETGGVFEATRVSLILADDGHWRILADNGLPTLEEHYYKWLSGRYHSPEEAIEKAETIASSRAQLTLLTDELQAIMQKILDLTRPRETE